MNGQSIPVRQPPLGINAALVASCLIHLAMVFLPYLGESTRETPLTAKTSEPRPQVITATLTTPKKAPFTRPTPPQQKQESVEVTTPPPSEPQPVLEQRQGADVLPIDAPLFYPADQLTQGPQPIEMTELDTPETKPIVASGTMVMKLWINDLGEVVDVEVEKTDLPETLVKSAIAVFKRMHFSPGERQGKHVGSVMKIEVTYDDSRKPPEPHHPQETILPQPLPQPR